MTEKAKASGGEYDRTALITFKGNRIIFEPGVSADPVLLEQALRTHHDEITAAIYALGDTIAANNPGAEISLPSMEVGELGRGMDATLTPLGRENGTSIHRDPAEINPGLLDRWYAVERAGFMPEVRSRMGKHEIALLFLRLHENTPEVDHTNTHGAMPEEGEDLLAQADIDSLPERLGLAKGDEERAVEQEIFEAVASSADPEAVTPIIGRYHDLLQAQVDALPGEQRLAAQLGLLVAVANIKRDIGELDEYVNDLFDANDVAEQLGDEDAIHIIYLTLQEILEGSDT